MVTCSAVLTGFGDTKGDKIAQSSNMTSFSRTFWDSNIGGAGGDVMEIVRRFIPSYKSGLNPLMNECLIGFLNAFVLAIHLVQFLKER